MESPSSGKSADPESDFPAHSVEPPQNERSAKEIQDGLADGDRDPEDTLEVVPVKTRIQLYSATYSSVKSSSEQAAMLKEPGAV